MAAGYPKLSYRTVDAGRHVYEVLVQDQPRGPKQVIGQVQRFGSLPSMQRWSACARKRGGWTRSRSSRADAAADLWSAASQEVER